MCILNIAAIVLFNCPIGTLIFAVLLDVEIWDLLVFIVKTLGNWFAVAWNEWFSKLLVHINLYED